MDGGSNSDIAEQILATVAGGITTYGSVSVDVPGEDDDAIEVCFNRADVHLRLVQGHVDHIQGQPGALQLCGAGGDRHHEGYGGNRDRGKMWSPSSS